MHVGVIAVQCLEIALASAALVNAAVGLMAGDASQDVSWPIIRLAPSVENLSWKIIRIAFRPSSPEALDRILIQQPPSLLPPQVL